ncbi:alpha/beta hydrolase fold domain-containing protein [Ornithinimicrobium sp. Y1847]|uniref:alpha/beta hydrolase fold domain-containing protein n=1 Tax=Ornithinimicrobium sp. Y1847 TaxID=3405419 RepID=UPI003B66B6E7
MDITELRPPVEDGPWPPITHFPPLDYPPLQRARSWTGLTYALVDGYRPLVLDVHVPEGVEAAPVVLWVHGGGWVSGDRRHVPLQWGQHRMFQEMIDAGLAVATADHRLLGEAPVEAAVHDLVAAIRYLRCYGEALRIDPDRVGLLGDSAGAHLAAMAGLVGSHPEPDPTLLGDLGVGGGRADVRAIVWWYGASDLTRTPALMEMMWPGESGQRRLNLARRLSPVTHLRSDSPPLLLMHGDRDSVAPVQEAQVFHAAAQAAGALSELVIVPGAEHVFLGAEIEPLWGHAIAFLRTHLADQQ